MSSQIFFKSKKAFIDFIKNKSDFAIEIISQTDEWIVFKCKAKINKPRCGTGGTGGNKRMTLNELTKIVLNLGDTVTNLTKVVLDLKTSVETGFANVNQRLDKVESRLDKVEFRLDNLEKDIGEIKRCPTIQKELIKLID